MRRVVEKVALVQLVLVVACITVAAPAAHADPGEKLVGFGGGVCVPGFEPQSSAAPALLSWGLQVFALYGPDLGRWSWDLSVGASLSWATYSGLAPGYTLRRGGETMHGDLYFDGALYHPEVFLQYELLSGFDVAPYLEASLGAVWTTFGDARLHGARGDEEVSASVGDFGRGGLTASLGLKVDWRIVRSLKVGASFKVTRSNTALLKSAVSVPVTLAYYWW